MEIREAEIDCLIEEVFQKSGEVFLNKTLGFTLVKEAGIDLDKLVVVGHQLGGLTALSASAGAKRVKAIATLDPQFTPYSEEITQGKLNIKDSQQAVCILETETFADEIDEKVGGSNGQQADL